MRLSSAVLGALCARWSGLSQAESALTDLQDQVHRQNHSAHPHVSLCGEVSSKAVDEPLQSGMLSIQNLLNCNVTVVTSLPGLPATLIYETKSLKKSRKCLHFRCVATGHHNAGIRACLLIFFSCFFHHAGIWMVMSYDSYCFAGISCGRVEQAGVVKDKEPLEPKWNCCTKNCFHRFSKVSTLHEDHFAVRCLQLLFLALEGDEFLSSKRTEGGDRWLRHPNLLLDAVGTFRQTRRAAVHVCPPNMINLVT